MRLSEDTLLVLAHLGDQEATGILFWLHGLNDRGRPVRPPRRDAQAWTGNGGRLGAGYEGAGHFATHMTPAPNRLSLR